MKIDEVALVQAPAKERKDFDAARTEQRDRRSGIDRRQFSYALHLPERRRGRGRRQTLHTKTGHDVIAGWWPCLCLTACTLPITCTGCLDLSENA